MQIHLYLVCLALNKEKKILEASSSHGVYLLKRKDINSALFFLKLIFLNNPPPFIFSYLCILSSCSPFLLHSLPPSRSIHCSLMCHLPVSKQRSTTLAQLGPKWVATPHKRWRTMLSPGQKQQLFFSTSFASEFMSFLFRFSCMEREGSVRQSGSTPLL